MYRSHLIDSSSNSDTKVSLLVLLFRVWRWYIWSACIAARQPNTVDHTAIILNPVLNKSPSLWCSICIQDFMWDFRTYLGDEETNFAVGIARCFQVQNKLHVWQLIGLIHNQDVVRSGASLNFLSKLNPTLTAGLGCYNCQTAGCHCIFTSASQAVQFVDIMAADSSIIMWYSSISSFNKAAQKKSGCAMIPRGSHGCAISTSIVNL